MGDIAKEKPPVIVRYSRPRRIKRFCEDTGISRPTVWRYISAGVLERVYVGEIPMIVGGPPGLFPDEQA
jgi:hypothetical protein